MKGFCPICDGAMEKKDISKETVSLKSCRNCGAIFQQGYSKNLYSQYNKDYFKGGIYGGYENYNKSFPYKKMFFESIINATIDRLPGKNILEIGCAQGFFMGLLKDRGFTVTGLDISHEAVEAAKAAGYNVFVCQFPDKFPDKKEHYDGIYMLDVLEHFSSPVKVMEKVFDLLRPGGILTVLVPNAGGLFSKILSGSWPHYKPDEHLWYPTKKSIDFLFKKAGLVDICITNFKKKYPLSYLSYSLVKQKAWLVSKIGKLFQKDFFSHIIFPFSLDEFLATARKPGAASRATIAAGYLRRYGPSMALWRTEELRSLQGVELPSPVLDLGCGNGYTSTFLQTAPSVGLDMNISDLKMARNRGYYRLLVKGDARQLPFLSSFFGAVFSNCALEHIPDPQKYLHEIKRVLKPGGVFVFSVPSEQFRLWLPGTTLLDKLGLTKAAKGLRNIFSFIMQHYIEKDEVWWRLKLEENGFEVDEIRPFMDRRRYRTFIFYLPLRLVYMFFMKTTGSKHNRKPPSQTCIKLFAGEDIKKWSSKSAGFIIIALKKIER